MWPAECLESAFRSRHFMKLNTVFRKLLLLAPAGAHVPESLNRDQMSCNPRRYEDYLDEVQRLRGRIYLEDGAIHESQLVDGRHVVESDCASWHLLVLDHDGKTCGCVRYRDHGGPVEFSELTAARSSLASCPEWGGRMRAAVEDELLLSDALELPFVEIGGWALDPAIRGTVEALRMVLGAYAFSREFGGAVGLATATVRHSSASILRRIGGQPLEHDGETVPAYADRQYNCRMELLRFHSWALNPRYDPWIEQMAEEIREVTVISAGAPVEQRTPKFVERIRAAVRVQRALTYPLSAIAEPAWE
jgi:hypothetical protein